MNWVQVNLLCCSVDSLESYIQLLHKISQDVGVKTFLHQTSKKQSPASEAGPSHSEVTVTITKADLPRVKWPLVFFIIIKPFVMHVKGRDFNHLAFWLLTLTP